jgi:hypothetical protein
MNYFNLKPFLLSAILVAGNNVEAVESQLRGDERKLQKNRPAGQYLLDAINTRNTQPNYPQWDYYGDDFIAYTNAASSSRGAMMDRIFNLQQSLGQIQTAIVKLAGLILPWVLILGLLVDMFRLMQAFDGIVILEKAEVTNVRTNKNDIGVRTDANIMNALRTAEYIEVFNAAGVGYPNFYGAT